MRESRSSAQVSRRMFCVFGASSALTGLSALSGCGESTKSARALPGPPWDAHRDPELADASPDILTPGPGVVAPEGMPSVIGRAGWARGTPVYALMNRMLPVRYITVHHDGMDAFTSDSIRGAQARLERIRLGHRDRGWGDIGYHFAVDRAGNVHECRPLQWQGAHVKDHNEGNIGILSLGNFDIQQPTTRQIAGVLNHVRLVRARFRIPAQNVRTHQEWAATACPGRNMQRPMVAARSSGRV